VRLLAARDAPDSVVDALRHFGCPKDLAQEIVARSRAPATRTCGARASASC